MSDIILTDKQKECVHNCYENFYPTLVEKSLSGCECCEDIYNGNEYVDMGEAGIWSKYPIGVSEWNSDWKDNIKYFAWGETEGYTQSQLGVDKQFTWNDYKWCEGENRLTKYCSNSNYGKDKTFSDEFTILLPEDDACTVNMGNNWRMPTIEEFQTLYSLCNNEWVINYNGVEGLNGILFKLKNDSSKQLFLPTTISHDSGSTSFAGSSGGFWSSSLYVVYPCDGFNLYFDSGFINPNDSNSRYKGYPVIGVLSSGQ